MGASASCSASAAVYSLHKADEENQPLVDKYIDAVAEVEKTIELIRTIRDQGMSIIIIEHVLRAMMSLSDHIVVISQGCKIAEGLPQASMDKAPVLEGRTMSILLIPKPNKD